MLNPDYAQDNIYANNIATDAQGNIYLLGDFAQSIKIGGKSLSKIDAKNAYLAKTDKNGNVLWLSQMTGGNSFITGVWTQDVTYADNDHIYVTGKIAGNNKFGNRSISTKIYHFSDGDLFANAVFVATYNSNGVCNDVKIFITEAEVNEMEADKDGNIILAGRFNGNVSDEDFATSYFGKTAVKATLSAPGAGPTEDAYVAKYKPDGTLIWVAYGSGTSVDRTLALSVGTDKSVYISGMFMNDINFKGKTKSSGNIKAASPSMDLFVAKLTPDGELEWFKTGGGTENDVAWDMIVKGKSIIVAGHMTGSIVFDNISKTFSNSKGNGALIKIN